MVPQLRHLPPCRVVQHLTDKHVTALPGGVAADHVGHAGARLLEEIDISGGVVRPLDAAVHDLHPVAVRVIGGVEGKPPAPEGFAVPDRVQPAHDRLHVKDAGAGGDKRLFRRAGVFLLDQVLVDISVVLPGVPAELFGRQPLFIPQPPQAGTEPVVRLVEGGEVFPPLPVVREALGIFGRTPPLVKALHVIAARPEHVKVVEAVGGALLHLDAAFGQRRPKRRLRRRDSIGPERALRAVEKVDGARTSELLCRRLDAPCAVELQKGDLPLVVVFLGRLDDLGQHGVGVLGLLVKDRLAVARLVGDREALEVAGKQDACELVGGDQGGKPLLPAFEHRKRDPVPLPRGKVRLGPVEAADKIPLDFV